MNTPLYRSVYDELKARIMAGAYPPATALPSESRLVDDFGVSLITVRRALQELVLDGLIERRQGIGSFVRQTAQSLVIGLSSFDADVAEGRLRLTRALLGDEVVPASDAVARRLRVSPGSPLRYLVRLDSQGTTPFSLDEVFTPPALATAITWELAGSPLFFPLWCAATGIEVGHVDYELSVQMPNATQQQQLRMDAETPLLVCGELNFDGNGSPVMWIVSYYRGDITRLTHSVRIEQQAFPEITPHFNRR